MNTALLNTMLAATAATGDAAAQQASMTGSIIYMIFSFGLVIVVFYFFMIRPQKKKEKEAKQLRDNLQIGDEVTTIGGITGIVVRKTEDTVVIETGGDRSKIRVKLWAISENATIHDMPEEEISKK
ncbi:MAG: preprotein translocase subunit YajC [Oscillospiraceae bacterium]|nr:preprotein translocase subunit YajC [Oscillospiraceae bacterium]